MIGEKGIQLEAKWAKTLDKKNSKIKKSENRGKKNTIILKKKKIVSHLKLTGVIGNVGKFKQGIEYSGQEDIIKKAFSVKKALAVAITINSQGGSPVQSHLILSLIHI